MDHSIKRTCTAIITCISKSRMMMAVILFSLNTFFLLSVKFDGFTTFLIIPYSNRQIQSNAHFIEVFYHENGRFLCYFIAFFTTIPVSIMEMPFHVLNWRSFTFILCLTSFSYSFKYLLALFNEFCVASFKVLDFCISFFDSSS